MTPAWRADVAQNEVERACGGEHPGMSVLKVIRDRGEAPLRSSRLPNRGCVSRSDLRFSPRGQAHSSSNVQISAASARHRVSSTRSGMAYSIVSACS